jgi:sugar lactone lactonase YvrE
MEPFPGRADVQRHPVSVPEPVGNLRFGGGDLRTLFIASTTTIRSLSTLVAGTPLPGR